MRPVIVLTLAIGMVIGGGVAYASHQFTDVSDGRFHDDIDFIADRGITVGCGGSEYCPDQYVTREEMAAFMERQTRVSTPQVISQSEYFDAGEEVYSCVLGSYTPQYEEQVVFSGGAYSWANPDETNRIGARVRYRADGGAWVTATGSIVLSDGGTDGEFMNVALLGALDLEPGMSYEFGVQILNSGTNGQCQLTAYITNRMPGQAIDHTAISPSTASAIGPNG